MTFDTEVLHSGKVRVTVEVDEKIVTFDWTVENAGLQASSPAIGFGFGMMNDNQDKNINLYFAMRFSGLDWRIGVE